MRADPAIIGMKRNGKAVTRGVIELGKQRLVNVRFTPGSGHHVGASSMSAKCQ